MTNRCPESRDGRQCSLLQGHEGLHQLPAEPAVTTRSYRGNLAKATAKYQADAALMARSGWVPTSQVYAPGSWGCGYFLIALLLCLVLIGILIFIAMIIVKPEGTLVVTYEQRR